MRDLEFVAGSFFDKEIQKDRMFLLRYFSTREERAFLRYYLIFGDYSCFKNHTGCYTLKANLKLLEQRLQILLRLHSEAKKSWNLDLLEKIESGKYRVRHDRRLPRMGNTERGVGSRMVF